MTRNLSLYFDLIRFIAAVAVVHSHFLNFNLFPNDLAQGMLEFGREAVIVFFVMSGYVIAYTTEHKNLSLREYGLARATRIFSVAIPVLILALVIGSIGIQLTPEKYQDFYQYSKPYFYIPFHLLFLGEIGGFYEKPFLVVPYWSLSYEVWYYVIFAAVFYIKPKFKWLVLSLLLIAVGPRLLLLLPIWWAGVWTYNFNKKNTLGDSVSWSLFFLSILLFVAFKLSSYPDELRLLTLSIWPESFWPLGSAERFLSDYIYGLLVVINMISMYSLNVKLFVRFKGLIRQYASYTFTLYLCHMLVIEPYTRHWFDNTNSTWVNFFTCFIGVALLTVLLGELTEKRRHIFYRGFKKLYFTRAS